jgi:hypothetical protein
MRGDDWFDCAQLPIRHLRTFMQQHLVRNKSQINMVQNLRTNAFRDFASFFALANYEQGLR